MGFFYGAGAVTGFGGKKKNHQPFLQCTCDSELIQELQRSPGVGQRGERLLPAGMLLNAQIYDEWGVYCI